MRISIATATFYYLPFAQTLDIIARAGFRDIELDLYWERDGSAMAEHLRDISAREAVRMIAQAGLTVSSIHDLGGILEEEHSARGFINPRMAAYLDALDYAPECIVFHTPHFEMDRDQAWWQAALELIVQATDVYRQRCASMTIENLPLFDNCSAPFATPEDLMRFAVAHDFGVTVDTTHYGEIGMDLVQATRALKGKVHTVHLSDYADGCTHLFVGDGALDLAGFMRELDPSVLSAITLECTPARAGEDIAQFGPVEFIDRLKEAKGRVLQLTSHLSS